MLPNLLRSFRLPLGYRGNSNSLSIKEASWMSSHEHAFLRRSPYREANAIECGLRLNTVISIFPELDRFHAFKIKGQPWRHEYVNIVLLHQAKDRIRESRFITHG